MRYDRRIERDDEQTGEKCQHRELEHPSGRVHPLRRDDHLAVHIPESDGFAKEQYHDSKEYLDRERGREHLLEPGLVVPAKFESKETAGCGRKGSGYHREHADESPHDIVYTVVLNTQCLQYQSAGIQRYDQVEEHPGIEQQGVLGDALGICQFVKHCCSLQSWTNGSTGSRGRNNNALPHPGCPGPDTTADASSYMVHRYGT